MRDNEVNVTQGYECLFQREYLRRWIDFCRSDKRKPKKLEDSAIRTYLGSVQHFHRFLQLTCADEIVKKKIDKLEKQIRIWRAPLWKASQIEEEKKKLEDITKFPTPEEFNKIDNCPHSNEARSILNRFSREKDREMRLGYFTHGRDWLLMVLLCDNSSRPGGVYNMTMGEYNSRHEDPTNLGSYVITVVKHKMSRKGPVHIAVSSTIIKYLDIFVREIRGRLEDITNNDDDLVFTTFEGSEMSGSLVGRLLLFAPTSCAFTSFILLFSQNVSPNWLFAFYFGA